MVLSGSATFEGKHKSRYFRQIDAVDCQPPDSWPTTLSSPTGSMPTYAEVELKLSPLAPAMDHPFPTADRLDDESRDPFPPGGGLGFLWAPGGGPQGGAGGARGGFFFPPFFFLCWARTT